jgi:hypothetical protein
MVADGNVEYSERPRRAKQLTLPTDSFGEFRAAVEVTSEVVAKAGVRGEVPVDRSPTMVRFSVPWLDSTKHTRFSTK